MYLPIYVSIYSCMHLSIHSNHPSIHVSIHLSVFLSTERLTSLLHTHKGFEPMNLQQNKLLPEGVAQQGCDLNPEEIT